MQDNAVSHGANNDPRFVDYYERTSASDQAKWRSRGILEAVLRSRRQFGLHCDELIVADIGCNAGTQSECWLEAGNTVLGLDISSDLVVIAARRNERFGERAKFAVGSANDLPWTDESFDVCLLSELLEHVEDWRACLMEAVRVLRRGGSIFLSTTNFLCPVQQEFSLPAYSWYPKWVKRRIVRAATSTAPQLVNYATHPAYHWFSPYALGSLLAGVGIKAQDRFDVMDVASKGRLARCIAGAVRKIPPIRFVGHMLTPGTMIVGHKL